MYQNLASLRHFLQKCPFKNRIINSTSGSMWRISGPYSVLHSNQNQDFQTTSLIPFQAGQWGFIEYHPPKKKHEYQPNIDHTALYRPQNFLKKRIFSLFSFKSCGIHLGKYDLNVFKRLSPEAPVRTEFLLLLRISEIFGFQWQNLAEFGRNSESFQRV